MSNLFLCIFNVICLVEMAVTMYFASLLFMNRFF